MQLPTSTPVAPTGPPRDWRELLGVTQTSTGCYQAQISIKSFGQGSKYIGTFSDPELAARAFDHAARILRGPDAELNFPNVAAGEKQAVRHVPKLNNVSGTASAPDKKSTTVERLSAADNASTMTTNAPHSPLKSSPGSLPSPTRAPNPTPAAATVASKAPLHRLSESEVRLNRASN